jgi:hypothetical protein
MTLIGIVVVCFGMPVLLIVVALAWLCLGQKILGCIFGGC